MSLLSGSSLSHPELQTKYNRQLHKCHEKQQDEGESFSEIVTCGLRSKQSFCSR